MAPITWRNVGTPNFGDSVAALGMAGNFLNRAFTGAAEGLGTFDTWRTEQNDRIALDAASRIQDPVAYRAALEAGTAMGGLPAGSISGRATAALDARSGHLIERAAAGDTFQNTRTDRAAEEGARNAAAQIQAAAVAGDQATVQRLTAQYGTQIGALPIDAQGRLLDRASGLIARDVSTQGGRLANEGTGETNRQRVWTNEQARTDVADNQRATRVMDDIRSNGDWGPTEVRARIDAERAAGASPRTIQRIITAASEAGFRDLYPNAFTPAAEPGSGTVTPLPTPNSGAVSGALRGSGTTFETPFNETTNYVRRISERAAAAGVNLNGTPEEVAERLAPIVFQQESGNRQTNARGEIITSPAGARGVGQLMPDTARALERRLGIREGLTSENTPEGREANARASRTYLADQLRAHSGNVDLALASYNAGPGRVQQWLGRSAAPVERGTVTEDRTRAAIELTTAAQITRGIEQRRAGDIVGTIATDFYELQRDNRTSAQVAADLIKPDGALAGVPIARVQSQIDAMMAAGGRQANLSPAMMGRLAAHHLRREEAGLVGRNLPGGVSRTVGIETGDPRFDTTAINADLARLLDANSNASGVRGLAEQHIWSGAEVAGFNTAQQRVQRVTTDIANLDERMGQLDPTSSAYRSLQTTLARRHLDLNNARERLQVARTAIDRPDMQPGGVSPPGARGQAATAIAATSANPERLPSAPTETLATPVRRGSAAAATPAAMTAPTTAELEARRATVARAAEARNPNLETFVANAARNGINPEELARAAWRLQVPVNELTAMIAAASAGPARQ